MGSLARSYFLSGHDDGVTHKAVKRLSSWRASFHGESCRARLLSVHSRQMFCTFLYQLRGDADRDLRHAHGVNIDSYRTSDTRQLLFSRNLVVQELLKDNAALSLAANHSKKGKGLLHPVF